jgi:large subunit ribosomal protein L25
MDVGDSLHLTDLNLPAGVDLLELARGEGHDLGVVSVHAKRGATEETAEEGAPEAAAEGGGEAGEAE